MKRAQTGVRVCVCVGGCLSHVKFVLGIIARVSLQDLPWVGLGVLTLSRFLLLAFKQQQEICVFWLCFCCILCPAHLGVFVEKCSKF